ncbi:hypothetical protein CK203_064911 [Vitis vinifera]|uniref:DUF4283 domain-containing protein n=1 Tax=Vitis vinifera TaxID=29760 RepID=A0A438FPP3_VITVI|nr:hypothetical protein CK203_064911 [Vitis vinifera]
MGWKMAKAWGLKGKMGIAGMGKGRALLEFEFVEEARRVHLSGDKVVGGVRMGLERWNPRSRCMEEGEVRREVWVRILGLPVSLWVPSVLRRVGDACGGFLDVDPKTERMEELQWARILIKSEGVNIPGSLVIGVEEISYSLSLWWEAVPVLRQEEGRNRGLSDCLRGEVRGDVTPRAGSRVKEKVGVGIEVQRQSRDGMCRQMQGEGIAERVFSHEGQLRGPDSWAGSAGPSSLKDWAVGPSLNPMGDQLGLRQVTSLGRASFSPSLTDKNRNNFMEHEFINYRVEEMGRRQQMVPTCQGAERMLEEEAARYGLDVNLGGLRGQGLLPLIFFCFGRSPEKEGYDHSGVQREGVVIGSGSRNPNVEDRIEKRNGCWDLVEINSIEPLGRNSGGWPDQTKPQEGSKEDQLNWEESSLIRFSQFLGFSTEGMEVEILNFLDKIRKRKEKIIGKGLMEASRGVNDRPKRKIIKSMIRSQKVDLFCLQETKVQVMSDEMVRTLGPGRFLDWKVLNAKGTTGGVIICWDKRSLEILGVEEANFPFPVDSGMRVMVQSGCSRGFMGLSPEKIGRAYGRNLEQSEDCGGAVVLGRRFQHNVVHR